MTSTIAFKSNDLYSTDLVTMGGNSLTTNLTFTYDASLDTSIPTLKLVGSLNRVSSTYDVTMNLGVNSSLGAGDFVISFDPTILSYSSYSQIWSGNDFVTVNTRDVASRTLKVSCLSMREILDSINILKDIFKIISPCLSHSFDISLTGSGTYDYTSMVSLFLNYEGLAYSYNGLGHNYSWVTITEPGNDTRGYAEYTCSRCGDVSESKVLAATGLMSALEYASYANGLLDSECASYNVTASTWNALKKRYEEAVATNGEEASVLVNGASSEVEITTFLSRDDSIVIKYGDEDYLKRGIASLNHVTRLSYENYLSIGIYVLAGLLLGSTCYLLIKRRHN